MTFVPNKTYLHQVFEIYHQGSSDQPKGHEIKIVCSHDLSRTSFKVDSNFSVSDVVSKFGIEYFQFSCAEDTQSSSDIDTFVKEASEMVTRKAVSAFQILMAGGRAYPEKKRCQGKVHTMKGPAV